MQISDEEMRADAKLAPKLKAWAAQLNLAAKAPNVPTFKINGPQQLTVRFRRHGMPSGSRAFMGDEEFRVSSILLNRELNSRSIKMIAILNPVDLALTKEVASVTMPLTDAIEAFTGLESWIDLAALESEERAAARAKANPPPVALPTVEESRAAETWGKW